MILDAARVMYARNAVPLRMIGSWKCINEGLRAGWRNEADIANESPQTEKEGIEIKVEAMAELSAFAQDPECRYSNETCSIDGYCQVGLGTPSVKTLTAQAWN